MAHPVLDPLAARLEADLRLRFPNITVRFAKDEEGVWMCRVEDGVELWGEVGTWFEDDDDLSSAEAERLLAEATFNVADNLWPDELTDPWPRCPGHGDHPLQPQFVSGRGVWRCLHDTNIVIPVGSLADN